MGVVINGVGTGLLAAIFVSLYMQGLFSQILPIWLIYGILAPLFSAVATTIMLFSQKRKRNSQIQWWEKEK